MPLGRQRMLVSSTKTDDCGGQHSVNELHC